MSGEEDEVVPTTITAVAAELKKHEKEDYAIHEKQAAMAGEASDVEKDEYDAKAHYKKKYRDKYRRMMKKSKEGINMSEPVNVFTNPMGTMGGNWGGDGFAGGGALGGLLIGALLGRGGFGFGAGAGVVDGARTATSDQLAIATGALTAVAGYNQLVNGQQTIMSEVASNGSQNLLATCGLGDRLSTQVCMAESNIVNNIGSQAGSIRAEISNLSLQSNQQFAALQLQNANNVFELSRQACIDQAATQASFSALALQNCQDQNALQAQIANCCCELKEAIAGVTAAAVKDELDELRLERALGNANSAHGNTINQIAVSLGSITQALAALQTKIPVAA